MVKEMDAQHRQLQQEAEKNHQAMMKQLGSAPDARTCFLTIQRHQARSDQRQDFRGQTQRWRVRLWATQAHVEMI